MQHRAARKGRHTQKNKKIKQYFGTGLRQIPQTITDRNGAKQMNRAHSKHTLGNFTIYCPLFRMDFVVNGRARTHTKKKLTYDGFDDETKVCLHCACSALPLK